MESARQAQSPRPSPASARDSPRPEQLRRKSTTAAGSGKPWELGQQDPRPGPASAQLPGPPSALPPLPLPYPQGGGTNLRCRGHSPGRKREPASGGAAGGAGGVSWEAPAPWAETGRARGSRGCGGAPSSWRAWGPDSSEARARLPGTALSPSPGEALRRPTVLEPGRRSQPPPLPPRAWGPGRLGKRSTQLPPGRVQFLRVSQRGSLVLGVWAHARAGGGQELELSPVSHREGGEGPA